MLDDTDMSTPRSQFLSTAIERGFIHQCTDFETLDQRLCDGRVSGYIGYDCTADSLHVGSLVGIMLLRLFQKCSHKPIVLMGGGTTRIGDPSGKDEVRRLLDDAEIAGQLLAEGGAVVVCGGRDGVMEAVSRGVAGRGGTCVGLLPGTHRREGNGSLTLALPTGLGRLGAVADIDLIEGDPVVGDLGVFLDDVLDEGGQAGA